jgi:ferredoxin-like protein FixX
MIGMLFCKAREDPHEADLIFLVVDARNTEHEFFFRFKSVGRAKGISIAGGKVVDFHPVGYMENILERIALFDFPIFIFTDAENGRGIIDPMPLEDDSETLKSLVGPLYEPEKLKYDDTLYVDKLTGVYLSKTIHREDQPCHIIVHDQELCVTECYEKYKNPCVRFCPGDVYEIETDESTGKRKLKLNFSNCLHCKTCDIKDPLKNVTWTCPEGGEGPGYSLV